MLIKIYGMGIKAYVRDSYNLFDGLLVIISLVEINLEEIGKGTSASSI